MGFVDKLSLVGIDFLIIKFDIIFIEFFRWVSL